MYNKEAHQHNFTHRSGQCRARFRSRFGEAFSGGFKGNPWREEMRRHKGRRKAVNIAEKEDGFILSLYAAGLKKEDFKIEVSNDILTISYQPGTNESTGNFIYEEYQPVGFKRSFQLNGKVLTGNVTATYVDGVLAVSLPKNPETNHPAQEIAVE